MLSLLSVEVSEPCSWFCKVQNIDCFDPHQFCPYCQMFAVSLLTEFADLSFFCSISPAPSLLQCWGSTASNGVSTPFQTMAPSCKAGTIYFHIFQSVILFLGVSLGPIPTVSQGCMFTKFKVPLLTSTLRRWPRPHLTSPLNLFLSRCHPHPPFLLIPSLAQEISPSRCFFYPLVLNLYSIPVLSLNLILYLMVNFQLVRYLWSWMLGKPGTILWSEVHRAVESFPASVSQRVTLLSQPVMSVWGSHPELPS